MGKAVNGQYVRGYIYLAYVPIYDAYKIGGTCDISRRLKELGHGKYPDVQLCHLITSDELYIQYEHDLQVYFEDSCCGDELFILKPTDVDLIKGITYLGFENWDEVNSQLPLRGRNHLGYRL